MRMMITHNKINPKVYEISKVDDTTPAGIEIVTLKQVLFDPKRDNVDLMVCDYYADTGDVIIGPQADVEDPSITGEIIFLSVNSDGELEPCDPPLGLDIGQMYYLSATSPEEELHMQWKVTLIGDYADKERVELERLMVVRTVDDTTISLKPGKSNRLKGLSFKITACDIDESYESTIIVEVNT